jgi:hypothetical protein
MNIYFIIESNIFGSELELRMGRILALCEWDTDQSISSNFILQTATKHWEKNKKTWWEKQYLAISREEKRLEKYLDAKGRKNIYVYCICHLHTIAEPNKGREKKNTRYRWVTLPVPIRPSVERVGSNIFGPGQQKIFMPATGSRPTSADLQHFWMHANKKTERKDQSWCCITYLS